MSQLLIILHFITLFPSTQKFKFDPWRPLAVLQQTLFPGVSRFMRALLSQQAEYLDTQHPPYYRSAVLPGTSQLQINLKGSIARLMVRYRSNRAHGARIWSSRHSAAETGIRGSSRRALQNGTPKLAWQIYTSFCFFLTNKGIHSCRFSRYPSHQTIKAISYLLLVPVAWPYWRWLGEDTDL